MHRFFLSFRRLIAFFLVMALLTSGGSMASYLCPDVAVQSPTMSEMMEDIPCAEMDKEKPVHCAEFKAGDKPALEFASVPTLTSPTIFSVMPAIPPVALAAPSTFWQDARSAPEHDPPYLRTQRLRI